MRVIFISGHQWSSVVISGHQWSSVVISRHQPSSAHLYKCERAAPKVPLPKMAPDTAPDAVREISPRTSAYGPLIAFAITCGSGSGSRGGGFLPRGAPSWAHAGPPIQPLRKRKPGGSSMNMHG